MNINPQLREIIEAVGPSLDRLKGKNIYITGGCGFLGSWFVAVFQELNRTRFQYDPCKVTVVDSFIATDSWNAVTDITDPNITFKRKDCSIYKPQGEFDFIIHAAGIASPIYYRKYPIETIDGMVLGCKILLDYAQEYGCESMLVFSSSEIYGNPSADMVPTPETYNGNVSPIGPRSCYDESKRMEEALCASYHRIHNIPVKWVRPFNVYGPGMRLKDDRVAPKFILAALRGEEIPVHFPGLQTRTLCYITDAMVGFFKVLLEGKDGEAYNIGAADPELSMVELAERIEKVFGSPLKITRIPMPQEYPVDQTQRRCPSLQKALQDVGYMPRVPLDKGLLLTIQWLRHLLSQE